MMFSLSGNKVSLGRTIPVPLTPKPVYAFDIDGVLCSTKEVHRAELERELGVSLGDGGHYDTFGFHHDDDAVMDRVAHVALDLWRRPTVFANGEASGRDTMQTLAVRGQFAGYVTRRHPDLEVKTYEWLFRHGFPGIWNPECLHHMLGDTESKAGPARKLGADALVEDSPKETMLAARDGLNVVVLRQPYNKDFEAQVQAGQQSDVDEPDALAYRRIRFISALEELL